MEAGHGIQEENQERQSTEHSEHAQGEYDIKHVLMTQEVNGRIVWHYHVVHLTRLVVYFRGSEKAEEVL